MNKQLAPLLAFSLLLGFLFDLLFYGKAIGISFFIYTLSTVALSMLLMVYYKRKFMSSLGLLLPATILFAAMTFIRASGSLLFFNILAVIYLLLASVHVMSGRQSIWQLLPEQYIKRVITLPLRFAHETYTSVYKLLRTQSHERPSKNLAPVIRGIVLSLPLLVIFLVLFSSADLVFKKYIGSIFNIHLSPELVFRLGLIAFVSSLFCGAYVLLFTKPAESVMDVPASPKWRLGTVESTTILGLVGALFLVFVLVQITYFFGGQSNITGAGFTYADYARRGFFELIAVAVISLLLILGLHRSTVRHSLQQKVTFMWLSGILVAEVLVIMLSAHKRLSLYEDAYGFTQLRLYSHLFIVWLAVAFLLVIVYIFFEKRPQQFAFQIFVSLLAFLAILNFINPDAMIARQNIQRYKSTGKIDVFYLTRLSEDAVPTTVALLNDSHANLQKSIAKQLYLTEQATTNANNHWQSFNIARNHAKRILASHHQQLEANKDYVQPASENYRE